MMNHFVYTNNIKKKETFLIISQLFTTFTNINGSFVLIDDKENHVFFHLNVLIKINYSISFSEVLNFDTYKNQKRAKSV